MSKTLNFQSSQQYFTVACPSSKRSYPTRAIAKAAAKELAKKGRGNMRPYICDHCETYHICHPIVRNGIR